MANTATALTPISMAMSSGRQGFSQVTPVVCTFDTLTTPLDVFTPSVATNHGAIIAMTYNEADAHSLVLSAASQAYVTLQLAANSGVGLPLGTGGFLLVGGKGQTLKIACLTATVATMLIHCVEFPSLNFNSR